MAENKNTTGNKSKLFSLLYGAIFIEFLVIAYLSLSSAPSQCPFPIDVAMPNIIQNLSNSLTVINPQKVLIYNVDANDGSGLVKAKAGGDLVETLYLSMPSSSDPNFINLVKDALNVSTLKLEKTNGKKSQGVPPPDAEMRQLADNASDLPNDDIFTFDKTSVVEKTDSKTKISYIEIPLNFKIRQTGYYRVDISASLNRAKFGNEGNKEIVNLDNSKACLNYSQNPKVDKELLTQRMNNLYTSLYITVMDGTQPPPQKLPVVPIEVKIIKK